jgi:hypothetical protein
MYTRLAIAAIIALPTLLLAEPPDLPLQIRYAANLTAADSVVNLTNDGSSSLSTGLATGGFQDGNLCANVYTYSPDEQLVTCCACNVTPNGLAALSVNNDLISNTLTPIRPSAVVIKLLGSAGTAGACNPATVSRTGANPLATGLIAWGTTNHLLPVTNGTPAATYGVTETLFSRAGLSDAELTRMTQLCSFIQANGSGYGICKSCRFGGLGGDKK